MRERTLVGTVSALLVVMAAAILVAQGPDEAGVRVLVRATARTSAVLLCLALASWAPALAGALAPRRAAFVRSLAVSHGLHLLAVLELARLTDGANLLERASAGRIGGGVLAYVVILAGALWPRHRLVEAGLLWVWVSFMASYVPRAVHSPWTYGPIVVLLLASLGLRAAGAMATRAEAPPAPGDVAA